MYVASRDHRLGWRLDDVHDSMQRVLGALARRRIAGEPQQLGTMRAEELAGQRHETGWQLVASARTGRTRRLMGLRRRLAPLPAAAFEDRATAGTCRRFPVLAFGLIGIVPQVVENAVAIACDTAWWAVWGWNRMSPCHDSRAVLECSSGENQHE